MPRNRKYYREVMKKMSMEEAEELIRNNLTKPQRASEGVYAKQIFAEVFGSEIKIKAENDRVRELIEEIKGEKAEEEVVDKLKEKIKHFVDTESVEVKQMEEQIAQEDERIEAALQEELEPVKLIPKRKPVKRKTRKTRKTTKKRK